MNPDPAPPRDATVKRPLNALVPRLNPPNPDAPLPTALLLTRLKFNNQGLSVLFGSGLL
jgi:hypothetical protein